MLLMRTLRDMNLSKLVAQDVPLFLSLLTDLFPDVGALPSNGEHPDVQKAMIQAIEKDRLTSLPSWNLKVIQLYETTLVRHGIMTVGPPGSGKSKIIKTLQNSLSQVRHCEPCVPKYASRLKFGPVYHERPQLNC